MPSITAAELQKLIETASYEHYARNRGGRDVHRPSDRGSFKRTRSRSNSRTRMSRPERPSSAPRRIINSSSKEEEEVPKKFERRRPLSAKPAVYSYKESDLDFTGVTNMMHGLKLKNYKKWRSKSNSTSDIHSTSSLSDREERDSNRRKFKSLEVPEFAKNRELDFNALRKSRSSSYGKFRYPAQMHNTKNAHAKFVLEQNIPPSLRRFPRYINQPVKQNCSYKPPVRSVTSVKLHNIKSNSLPIPPAVTSKPPVPPSKPRCPAMIDSQATAHYNTETDELDRNGTFHYVYEGPPSNFNTIVEVQDDSPQQSSRVSQIIPSTTTPDMTGEPLAALGVINDEDLVEELHSDSNDTDNNFAYDNEDDTPFTNSIRSPKKEDEEEKLSYGDINDLQEIDDIAEEILEQTTGIGSKPNKNVDQDNRDDHWSSEDEEIEEDIPENIDSKPVTFMNNNASQFQYGRSVRK